MRNIYIEYNELQFLQRLVAEIPWGQNLITLEKVKDPTAREYYLKMTAQQGWTKPTLVMQIDSQAYERHLLTSKQHNFAEVLPQHLAEQANNTMKDIYMLDTLGLSAPVLEADIENRMVARIKTVMLELDYALRGVKNPVGVSEFRLSKSLPKELIDKLPNPKELEAELMREVEIEEIEEKIE